MVYDLRMNDSILKLSLRIAADITMGQPLKDELLEQLSKPLTEEQVQGISQALDTYQSDTKPVIDRAMNRLSDTELIEIENKSTHLIAAINSDVESYVGQNEKHDAENILSSI